MNAVHQTPMTHLDAALRYAARGWRVFPLQPREKKPLPGSHGLNDATTDEAIIRAWWGKHPDANIGLATGHGWFVVDIDGPEGEAALADLERLHGVLPATVEQRTGRGRHLLFRDDVPFGDAIRNSAGQIGPKIDVRGLGGYIVAPPSIHPDGRIYQWASGAGPKNREIAEAPPWLVRAAEKPTQEAQKAAPDSRKAERVDFDGVAAQSASGDSYGAAALAGECEAIRAAPNGRQQETLNSAALKIGSLVAGESLDRDAARAALIAAGMAMTSYDARRPWTHSEVSRAVDRGLRDGARNPRGPTENATRGEFRAVSEPTPADAWPPLISLDHASLPVIDPTWLPGWAGDFAAALAAQTETPPELAAGLVLATCSVATARRFRVVVEPGYVEPTNLWIAVALPPGNRKSAVQNAAARPLMEWERDQAETLKPEIIRVASEVKNTEARVAELRKKGAREKEDIQARALMAEATEMESQIPTIPRAPQIWTSDVTPEKLGVLLADNEERMAWLSSEGGVFDTLAGRYSGGIPNLDLILKAHSGDAERVDRGSRPPVYLQHPLLSIGLSPQPEVLRGLASKPGFRGRGLLGRFLYLLPASPLGFRTLKSAPIPQAISRAYEAGVRRLLDTKLAADHLGNEAPHSLRLSAAAYSLWKEFQKHIEAMMRPGAQFEGATDWAGKCPGAAARLAAVLHAIERPQPWATEISEGTVERALELMAVFAQHSRAALSLMGDDDSVASARQVWTWAERGRRARFTIRDSFNELRGSFPRTDMLKGALGVLEERGYIEIIEPPASGKAGRRGSPTVIVRPDIAEGWR